PLARIRRITHSRIVPQRHGRHEPPTGIADDLSHAAVPTGRRSSTSPDWDLVPPLPPRSVIADRRLLAGSSSVRVLLGASRTIGGERAWSIQLGSVRLDAAGGGGAPSGRSGFRAGRGASHIAGSGRPARWRCRRRRRLPCALRDQASALVPQSRPPSWP